MAASADPDLAIDSDDEDAPADRPGSSNSDSEQDAEAGSVQQRQPQQATCYTKRDCIRCRDRPPERCHRWVTRGVVHCGGVLAGRVVCSFCHRINRCAQCRSNALNHGRIRYFVCTHQTCRMVLSRMEEADRHSAVTHSTVRNFHCAICPLKFKEEERLRSHYVSQHRGEDMDRWIIEETVGLPDDEHPDPEPLVLAVGEFLTCHVCFDRFEEERQLKIHLIQHHNRGVMSDEERRAANRRIFDVGETFLLPIIQRSSCLEMFQALLAVRLFAQESHLLPFETNERLLTAGFRIQYLLARLRAQVSHQLETRRDVTFALEQVNGVVEGNANALKEVWSVYRTADVGPDQPAEPRPTGRRSNVEIPLSPASRQRSPNGSMEDSDEDRSPAVSQDLDVGESYFRTVLENVDNRESFETAVVLQNLCSALGFCDAISAESLDSAGDGLKVLHEQFTSAILTRISEIRHWRIDSVVVAISDVLLDFRQRWADVWFVNRPGSLQASSDGDDDDNDRGHQNHHYNDNPEAEQRIEEGRESDSETVFSREANERPAAANWDDETWRHDVFDTESGDAHYDRERDSTPEEFQYDFDVSPSRVDATADRESEANDIWRRDASPAVPGGRFWGYNRREQEDSVDVRPRFGHSTAASTSGAARMFEAPGSSTDSCHRGSFFARLRSTELHRGALSESSDDTVGFSQRPRLVNYAGHHLVHDSDSEEREAERNDDRRSIASEEREPQSPTLDSPNSEENDRHRANARDLADESPSTGRFSSEDDELNEAEPHSSNSDAAEPRNLGLFDRQQTRANLSPRETAAQLRRRHDDSGDSPPNGKRSRFL